MTIRDGEGSQATPFSGDEGKIFENQDLVLESPTTLSRVVDTQSGFLVIVKRAQERLALSLKRRLGTPPQSHIMLTPDESLQLSRILADSWKAPKSLSPEAQDLVDNLGSGNLKGLKSGDYGTKVSQGIKPVVLVMVALALFNFAAGSFAGYFAHSSNQPVVTDALSKKDADQFARQFVTNLLDFNPDSYRNSQIKAMSQMTPELLNTYWTDTNFPLSKEQLIIIGKGSTVEITSVESQKLDKQTATADVVGQMSQGTDSKPTPVHLQLKLALGADGQIQVTEQIDLASAAESNVTNSTPEPKTQEESQQDAKTVE